jgi:hypothetical protein
MSIQEFGSKYVTDRGTAPEFALAQGLEETAPSAEIVNSRLNFRLSAEQVRKFFACVISLLWFPLPRPEGLVNYVARVNGIYRNGEGEEVRFLFTKGARRTPWIPGATAEVAKAVDAPIIFTESYFKGLTVLHAGGHPIAYNGLWICEPTADEDKDKPNNRVLVRELADGWRFKTRKVFFGFDMDQASNESVRQAIVQAWIVLEALGAEVYQLEWPSRLEGKVTNGIDDFLAATCGIDPARQAEELGHLKAVAKPFSETLVKGPGGDARYVRTELRKVRMDVTDREAFAKKVAPLLGVTKASLLQGEKGTDNAKAKVLFPEIEPWDSPVDGNELLAGTQALIRNHIYISEDDLLTASLWVFWSYLVAYTFIEVSPYLAVTSPDKRCGKSRLLEVLEWIVCVGFLTSDISKSSFFRMVEKYRPTLLIDELHKALKARPDLLQPLLNGYSRNKRVVITNAETLEPEIFDIWGARVIAYLEELDDQLRDRAIEIRLERKPRKEKRARLRTTSPEYTHELCRKLLRWARDNAEAVSDAPSIELDIDNDRAEDNWEWLIKIAGVIDPDNGALRARQVALKKESEAVIAESESEAVLAGIRRVHEEIAIKGGHIFENPAYDRFLALTTICEFLNKQKLGIWQNWKWGENYGPYPRKIAQILRSYTGKKPDRSRDDDESGSDESVNGYWLKDLRSVFETYK